MSLDPGRMTGGAGEGAGVVGFSGLASGCSEGGGSSSAVTIFVPSANKCSKPTNVVMDLDPGNIIDLELLIISMSLSWVSAGGVLGFMSQLKAPAR